MPTELPADRHRVTRAKPVESLSRGVPWMIAARGKLSVWDPHAGLLAIRDVSPHPDVTFDPGALSRDGRAVHFNDSRLGPLVLVEFDLVTRMRREVGLRIDEPHHHRRFLSESGAAIDFFVRRAPEDPGTWLELRHDDQRIRLAADIELTGATDTHPVHFAVTGTHVAVGVSYYRARPARRAVLIVDLRTGVVEELDGGNIAGSVAWSPRADRLLVRTGSPYEPAAVYDLESRKVRRLVDVLPPRSPEGEIRPFVAGWVDDSRVLVSERVGRRLMIDTLDVDSGDRVALLDVPIPGAVSDLVGPVLAPARTFAEPDSIGPASSRRSDQPRSADTE
jgi:ketosteroid isomerase-like protein